MDIKLDDLLSFVATVRHQSISRAADALGLTQPAVTRRVQNLEEALTLTLLDRITKPPKPTAIGLHVYEQCVKVLQEVEALKSFSAGESVLTGPLRLGLTLSLADAGLADMLLGLQAQFPQIQPQVTTRFSSELLKLIVSGELDAAAASLPLHQSFSDGVNARLIGALQVVIVAAKGRFSNTRSLCLANISDAGWVLNPSGCGIRRYLQTLLAEHSLPMHLVTEAFGTDLQLKTVASGAGLGLLPRSFLPYSHYAKELDILDVEDFIMQSGLWLLSPVRSHLPPASLNIIAQILSKLTDDASGPATATPARLAALPSGARI